MKMFVYEDGDRKTNNPVDLDLENLEEVKRVLNEQFDCGHLDDSEVEIVVADDEVYVSISEVQYLWNK